MQEGKNKSPKCMCRQGPLLYDFLREVTSFDVKAEGELATSKTHQEAKFCSLISSQILDDLSKNLIQELHPYDL
jgi:hypothetical protein